MARNGVIKVALVQRVLTHYRLPLYKHLAELEDLDITCFHSRGLKRGAPEAECRLQIKSERVPILYRPFSAQALYQGVIWRIVKGGFDVVVCTHQINPVSSLILWFLRGICGYRFIWWGMGFDPYRQPSPLEKPKNRIAKLAVSFKNYLLQRSDALMLYSREGLECAANLGISREKCFVLYNTLDVDELRSVGESVRPEELIQTRKDLDIEAGAFVYLFLGRLHRYKEVPFLIKAFAKVARACRSVKLVIVGDGEERERIQGIIEENTLGSRVVVVGAVYDIRHLARIFLVSDLVVLPGQVGLAICHAFAYGKPVLGRPSQSYSSELEYLENNVNGLRLEDADLEAYARAMIRAYHDRELVHRLSKGARTTGLKMSMNRMAQRFREAVLFAYGVTEKN